MAWNAGSELNDGSVVAGCALSGDIIPGGAEIANSGANLGGVEKPSLGALNTDSVTPDSAADVVRCGGINLLALAINDGVSSIALLADALLGIELLAGTLNLAANSIFIEEEPIGAFQAGILTPHLATEVVVKLSHESGIVELLSTKLVVLCKSLTH